METNPQQINGAPPVRGSRWLLVLRTTGRGALASWLAGSVWWTILLLDEEPASDLQIGLLYAGPPNYIDFVVTSIIVWTLVALLLAIVVPRLIRSTREDGGMRRSFAVFFIASLIAILLLAGSELLALLSMGASRWIPNYLGVLTGAVVFAAIMVFRKCRLNSPIGNTNPPRS